MKELIIFLDPPSVSTFNQQHVIEGENLLVICNATLGYPKYTTFFWTKINNSRFEQVGPTLRLPSIQRSSSGTYICKAENIYINGIKGTHSQMMVVNVLCTIFKIYS